MSEFRDSWTRATKRQDHTHRRSCFSLLYWSGKAERSNCAVSNKPASHQLREAELSWSASRMMNPSTQVQKILVC